MVGSEEIGFRQPGLQLSQLQRFAITTKSIVKQQSMSIQDLGAMGELIAAIATIFTLLFLAISIRTNSKTVTASAKQEQVRSLVEFNREIFQDENSTRIFIEGSSALTNLNQHEKARFRGLFIMGLITVENAYYQANQGHLDKQSHERNNRILEWWGAQPGMVEMWPDVRQFLTEDFQSHFDQYIQKTVEPTEVA